MNRQVQITLAGRTAMPASSEPDYRLSALLALMVEAASLRRRGSRSCGRREFEHRHSQSPENIGDCEVARFEDLAGFDLPQR